MTCPRCAAENEAGKRFCTECGTALAVAHPEGFKAAAAGFREDGITFWLAVTLLEHGELTRERALLDEAREIFEGLKATPLLERACALARTSAEPVPAST
jgi:tRNA(Leu) C34 or U34 (ribose-2'-O)-methylase TrmL